MEEMRPTVKGTSGGDEINVKFGRQITDEMRCPAKCRGIKGFSAADLVSILIDL